MQSFLVKTVEMDESLGHLEKGGTECKITPPNLGAHVQDSLAYHAPFHIMYNLHAY